MLLEVLLYFICSIKPNHLWVKIRLIYFSHVSLVAMHYVRLYSCSLLALFFSRNAGPVSLIKILLVLSSSVFYVFPILCNTWRIWRAPAHSGLWKKKVLSLQMAGRNDGMVRMMAHSILLTIPLTLWLITLCEIIKCLCHLNSCTFIMKQSNSGLWLIKDLKMSSLVNDWENK